ncbi:MAG: hypothetical protein ACIARR_11425, partial [Phycisphaerales bacterium JB059]
MGNGVGEDGDPAARPPPRGGEGAESRSRQYAGKGIDTASLKVDSLDFQLIRSRLLIDNYEYKKDAVKEFEQQLENVLAKKSDSEKEISNDEIIARY